ncbi:hypothetical protein RO3G_09317 [Lichtheimia corymbifera JMRC:FSU:9682]|uniref:TOG domain-containing protein n=1 Tax=Lichtheimia corymbifera JMRC:FSU:9682 TaxID=1263082 RepID=A0A068RTB7_9FUNG|nr:hypothetical protein RO3G_09317 [Lichtheimia corymbifera JMRC:FSU:9682]
MAALSNITNTKELERQLSAITTALGHNSNADDNWQDQEKALQTLRNMLNGGDKAWKDSIVREMRALSSGVVQCVGSLRTSLSLAGINVIADLGKQLGYDIDIYTHDTLLLCLLRCASSTKRMIATNAMEATRSFLSNTPFRHRTLQHVSALMNDKNVQARHHAMLHLQTILETHTSHIDNIDNIETCLTKGLVDAAPSVREASRSLYSLFQTHWPERASRLIQGFDAVTQKQLSILEPKRTPSRQQQQPATALSSKSRIRSISHPPSPQPTPSQSAIPRRRRLTRSTSTIPRKRSLEKEEEEEEKDAAAPTTSIETPNDEVDRRMSLASLSSAALLGMLNSNDATSNCRAIRMLAGKLKHYPSSPLPRDIPDINTLVPILLNYLTSRYDDTILHETLTSWDCLAGIFTRVLTLEQYLPVMISASQNDELPSATRSLYTRGLARLKFFLNHQDPQIPERLVHLLSSLQHDPSPCRQYLLEWLDELVCTFVGLEIDQDTEICQEGKSWLSTTNNDQPWLEEGNNIRQCLVLILSMLQDATQDPSSEYYTRLVLLAGRLKLSNEHVFDLVSGDFEKAVEKMSIRQSHDSSSDNSMGITALEEEEQLQQDNTSADTVSADEEKPTAGLIQIRMQKLAECIRHLQRQEPSEAIIQQLEALSDATPVIQRHHIYSGEGDLWIGPIEPRNDTGKMYLSLMECIITFLQSTSHNVQIKIQAIRLVKRLLNNQSAVFSYYQENGKKHGDPTACIAYPLANALLTGIENDRNQEMSCEDVFDDLFSKIPDENERIRLLWSLLNEREQHNKALAVLLIRIGQLSPNIPKHVLKELLDKQAVTTAILIKSGNHSETSVRVAWMQAIVGIHKTIGEEFFVSYLTPLLRVDQLGLVKHYISQNVVSE